MENETDHSWPKVPCLVLALSAAWFLSAPILGHMGRPWPCVFIGAAIALCAFMMYRKPLLRRTWAILAVIIAAASLLLGSGAIIPALAGIAGGAFGIVWTAESASSEDHAGSQ